MAFIVALGPFSLGAPPLARAQTAPAAPATPPAEAPVAEEADAAASPVTRSDEDRAPNEVGADEPRQDDAPPPNADAEAPPSDAAMGEAAGGFPYARAAHREDEAQVRYLLEKIEIRGNRRTRESVVRRYVPFTPGEVLDVDDPSLQLSRYRLLGTGFFSEVEFSLRKGSRPGRVILVIDVVERNTVILNDFAMGLSADADTHGKSRPLTAFAGADVAETNLAGTGITIGTAFGIAQDQLALRVRFFDPAFLGSDWLLSTTLLYNDARDFFGNSQVRWWSSAPDPTDTGIRSADHAVVRYVRSGGSVGVGRDLGVTTQAWFRYRLEAIGAHVPEAASHVRGGEVEPLLIDLLDGRSVLSTVQASLQLDSRDHPILPTQGWYATVSAEFGLPEASDYRYQRLDATVRHWWQLPWKRHVVGLNLFTGAISGDAPFFEQYFVGDFSEFLTPRLLGLNFDRRPPPNFLGTAIEEVRYGNYAAKVGGEYRIPLYRGHRSVFGIDFFGSAGAFMLASRHDIDHPPATYSGLSRIPVGLTSNLGLRMDTSMGGIVFSLSNFLGFIPVRRVEP